VEETKQNKHLIEITTEYNGIKLDKFCSDKYSVSFSLIRKMCRKGQVRLNSSRVKGNETLKTGDIVKVPNLFLNSEPQEGQKRHFFSPKEVQEARKWILFEDSEVIVINKPAGIPVQAGSKQNKSIDRLFEQMYPENPPKLVHRLDKETSGCLVLAKNKAAAKNLATQFAKRETHKTYITIVVGDLLDPTGEIDFSVEKVFTEHNKERMKVVAQAGKEAKTFYQRLDRHKQYHLLEVQIETGRTHQIRVHMQSIGTPILGDTKYSDRDLNTLPNGKIAKMCLHSYNIEFEHPVTGELSHFYAPISDRMLKIMDTLKLQLPHKPVCNCN
jgi:23S rRNA pseudouridine955/2504/2580 synthase